MSDDAQTAQLRIGDWLVMPSLDQIERAGETVKLEPRTMRLLLRLSETPGDVVSGQQLLDDVWAGVVVSSQSVYQAISQLRKLLGDVEDAPTYIATVPRKGYRLVAPVQRLTSGDSAPLPPVADPHPASTPSSGGAEAGAAAPWSGADRRAPVKRRKAWIGAAIVVLVAVAGAWPWIQDSWRADVRKTSVVVLPFVDMTEDQKDAALTDGLTEELSTSLSQLPALRVIARTSAYAVRDQKLDARQIGEKLSATHIIEGTVRRSGDMVRVTAQLVDAQRGHRSWSEVYDLPAKDLLRLQTDLARSVVQALEIRFSEDDSRRLSARSPKTAEAYEMYLLGRHHFRQRTVEGNRRALELSRRALELDRNFALAYVGLAQAKLNESVLVGKPVARIADSVTPLLETALRINPKLAEAYATRGFIRRELNRLDAAESDLRKAIELDPSNVTATANLARTLEYQGRVRDALEQFTAAYALDPLDFMRHVDLCTSLTDIGRFDDAERNCGEARRLQPDSEWPYIASLWLSRSQGRTAQAIRWSDAAIRVSGGSSVVRLNRIEDLMTLSLHADAREALQKLMASEPWHVRSVIMYGELLLEEKGKAAARDYVQRLDLPADALAADLLAAARLAFMVGDVEIAERYAGRARGAPGAEHVAVMQRVNVKFGAGSDVALAQLELQRGERAAATSRLRRLLAMLEELQRNGQASWGVHSLRAEAFAALGEEANALDALRVAIDSGWREWWTTAHSPLAGLSHRPEFGALRERVERLNSAERQSYLASVAPTN